MNEANQSDNSQEKQQAESLNLEEFKTLLQDYKLVGENPTERSESLRSMDPEAVAIMLTDLNRRILGRESSAVSVRTVDIESKGDKKPTIKPEDRYDLFFDIFKKIKTAPENISPQRLGDSLALATVLLHPFEDGNGRTARLVGYVFSKEYDGSNSQSEDFDFLVASRSNAKEVNQQTISRGYIPYMDRVDLEQSNPNDVRQYFDMLLDPNNHSPELYDWQLNQASVTEPDQISK